jgi:hypothetical protein
MVANVVRILPGIGYPSVSLVWFEPQEEDATSMQILPNRMQTFPTANPPPGKADDF